MLKLAKLVSTLDEKFRYWKAAQGLCPERLEAFYDMMNYFHLAGDHALAGSVYFIAPKSRTPPPGSLFIEQQVYDYLFDLNVSVSLHLSGQDQKAYEVGSALVARKTYPPHEAELVERNLRFFREKYNPLAISVTSMRTTPISEPLPSYIVIDNFYEDPVGVRERALKMNYPIKGNYPGARTLSTATDADRLKFEQIVGRKITYWPTQPDQYNGSYQYTTKEHKSWIHRDPTNFSVVVYLTPDAPANGGTVLYRHRTIRSERVVEKSAEDVQLNSDGNDESKWEIMDRVGNKFNRAIIFQGGISHKSDTYFGDDIHNGRLFQTFFFNVEGRKY
jgi:hypothetical protein